MSLLERETELAALDARAERLRTDGAGGVVLIEGPPGIGKSALLETALSAVPHGVLRARGSELESGLAFGAVRQLLVPAVRAVPPAEREELLAGPSRLAARVLGFGSEAADDELADPLFSLHWLLAELAAREPLVVAIDDLHWLDEESGRFAGYLARRLEGEPILMLATARPGEPGATTPVTAVAETAEVVRPRPLSEAAIERLLAGACNPLNRWTPGEPGGFLGPMTTPIAGRDAAAAHRATGGNPLLATQLAQAPPDLPFERVALTGVGEMVLERVERLSEDAVRLVRAVSLFAARVRLEDAAAVAELAPAEAAAAADGLVAAQVLAGEDTLGFLHPVMRTAVYDSLGPFARRAGHSAAARVLRERGAPLEEIAAHLLSGAPGGDPENVRLLRQAASAAIASAAPRAAARYLQRAIEEPVPAGQERFAVLFDLGRLQGRLGRPEAAETLALAAEAAPDPYDRAEATIHRAAVLLAAGRDQEAYAALQDLARRAELGGEQRLMVDGMLAACGFHLDRQDVYVAAVDRLPDDMEGESTAQRIALLWVWMRRFHDGSSRADLLAGLLRCIDEDGVVAFAQYGLLTFDPVPQLQLVGAFDTLEAIAETRMAVARERGDEAQFHTGLLARASSLQLRGRWKLAEADLRQVIDTPGITSDQLMTALEMLVEPLARQRRFEEAEAVLERLAGGGVAPALLEVRRAIMWESGHGRGGFEPFKAMADWLLGFGFAHPAQRRWLCSYADGLVRVGRIDEARAEMEAYLREAETFDEPAALGHALIVLGRIERGERAIEVLDRAVKALEPSPHEWLLGQARLELGAALRRENRRAESREPLGQALAYATEHGDANIAMRAQEELRLAGGSTREARGRDRDALTPAEERVARLAADGLSNKQIAAELFLTVGSVQTTLIRVFRKLGINSRRDLPEAMAA